MDCFTFSSQVWLMERAVGAGLEPVRLKKRAPVSCRINRKEFGSVTLWV